MQASELINENLVNLGLFSNPKRAVQAGQNSSWRISPQPYEIPESTYREIRGLGKHLHSFYTGVQRLYEQSLAGRQPGWIAEYLEMGKTEAVIDYGRMRRFKHDYPLIIRPDILLTDDGFVISELDSVPGGFGLTAALSHIYGGLGYDLIGGSAGIVRAFAEAIRESVAEDGAPDPTVAIIVSEESSDYWGEMQWMADALSRYGLGTYVIRPEEVIFREDGLFLDDNGLVKIDVVYRFFELFDLKNIPKIDLLLYAIRKQLVRVTPPLKSYYEEKLLFACIHHPALATFWEQHLGAETYDYLIRVIPQTWVLDSRPSAPHTIIPGLEVNGQAVTDWQQLKYASKRQRQFVIKISGFSPLAWGSRGVQVGHDMPSEEWATAINSALESFGDKQPYILQRFHKAKKVSVRYHDFRTDQIRGMQGRVRLCPYYFVSPSQVELAGMLATICPLDKKLIHGMVDAVMVPTMLLQELSC